ncbi:uncharacterized protein LOC119652553 isoform X3 [Hermetia illucens]|uniref:uncharacterized protein LOC119652553 isoform X3 n=1 Tax=Hermetia illucens TaxID=343691 RepID=UPI0018CC026C|nr:uncharacterized protein LOC119652553 isoform X3 [Hermetia illucens]
MLNCTDLACVLHHHHFYAHLHQLKHHLQDDNHNTGLGDGGDIDNNDDIQGLLNDTDAPNDVIYMACGVVIAMLLVGLIIVLVAVTINKLRKREETSVSPVTVEAQTTTTTSSLSSSPVQLVSACVETQQNQQQIYQQQQQQQQTDNQTQLPSSVWRFPPLPPQPNLYCANGQDAFIQGNDKAGFKGFRKQFSGRFKRLVAKKSNEPAPAIPPELKPQLKTIYVY